MAIGCWLLAEFTIKNSNIYKHSEFIDMKYEEAIKELENIVSQIEKNELDIDQLTDRLKVAQELIKQCRDKLYKTDEEIKAMLEE